MRDQAAFERRVDDLLHVDVDRRIHVEPPTQQVLEPVRDTLRFEFLDHMANGRRGMNNHAGARRLLEWVGESPRQDAAASGSRSRP